MKRRRSRLSRVSRFRFVPVAAGVAAASVAMPVVGGATLIHHWPGEGNGNDVIGKADGIVIGAVSYDAGRVGHAFRFVDGAAIAIPSMVGDAINRDFTVALWCRVESPVAAAILQQGDACGSVEWFRMESRPDGDLQCSMSDDETGTLALLTREADLFDRAWHHIAWRREGITHSVFVDGCLLVSPTSSDIGGLAIATDLLLGGPWCTIEGDAGSPFAGWIDEVQWFDGALSEAQIRALSRGPAAADLTGDGTVDGADLAELLGAWGPCGSCCAADLDGDGAIDGADLGVVLGAWTND